MLSALVLLGAWQAGRAEASSSEVVAPNDVAQLDAWTSPCRACEWGVRELEDAVADPRNEKLAVSVANSIICSHLPAADQKGCYNHIVSALDYAVETLEDYISPRTLCRPLCGREPRALAATAVRDSSWKCPFCEFIATRAESALRDKKTDKEILKFLRKECRNLPESFADPCVNYVNEDGPVVLVMLETLPPEEVCERLGACQKGPVHAALAATAVPEQLATDIAFLLQQLGAVTKAQACAAPPQDLRATLGVQEPTQECRFCKIAVMEARQKIADPQFQAAIEHYLEKLCNNAGDYAEMCHDSVQQYAPLAFAVALDYLRPATICVDLVHLCPTKPELSA